MMSGEPEQTEASLPPPPPGPAPAPAEAPARKPRRWFSPGAWLAGLYRRVTLSLVLSALLHAAVAGVILLITLHGGGGEDYFHDRQISVSLIGGAASDGGQADTDAAPKPDRKVRADDNQVDPDQPPLADKAAADLKKEQNQAAREAVEGAADSAARTVDAQIGQSVRQADLAFQKRQQKVQGELIALQAAGKAQSAAAAQRIAALEAELDRLARERAAAMGRRVSLGDTRKGGGGESIFRAAPVDAKKIVYVVDRSGSMQGMKFQLLQAQLVTAVDALEDGREFWVVFYASTTQGMGAAALLPATKGSKAAVRKFVYSVGTGGNTRPKEALRMAMRLKPDLIYLLTDGIFDDPDVEEFLDQLNADGRVVIDTICFLDPQGEAVLRRIAQKNRGTFTMVSK